MDNACGRVKFARILYNLLHGQIDMALVPGMKKAIRSFNQRVHDENLKSMHTGTKSGTNRTSRSLKCPHSNSSGSAGGGGGGEEQLRAQGYGIKSDTIVDDRGIEWKWISEVQVSPFLPALRYADARH